MDLDLEGRRGMEFCSRGSVGDCRWQGQCVKILLTHIYAWPEVRRGGERYLHELAAALQRAGHEVTILTTAPQPRVACVLGCEVRYLSRPRFLRRRGHLAREIGFGLQALLCALAMKVDVWHALGRGDALAAVLHAKLRRTTSVYTALGMPLEAHASSRVATALQRVLARTLDHYLVLSTAAAQSLERHWGRRPRVVGGGVNLNSFRPGAPKAGPSILYSGSLNVPRKHVRQLIQAVLSLAQDWPRIELWLSGPGDLEPLLDGVPPQLRRHIVAFGEGSADELFALYGRAWVTALPSVDEAFGLALIESLACGTPVVAVEDAGPRDIVSPGVGALATSADSDAIAEACRVALSLARQDGIADRCRRAAERFGWDESIVPKLEAIYSARATQPTESE